MTCLSIGGNSSSKYSGNRGSIFFLKEVNPSGILTKGEWANTIIKVYDYAKNFVLQNKICRSVAHLTFFLSLGLMRLYSMWGNFFYLDQAFLKPFLLRRAFYGCTDFGIILNNRKYMKVVENNEIFFHQ